MEAGVRSARNKPVGVFRRDSHLRVKTAIELGTGEQNEFILVGVSETFWVVPLSDRTIVLVNSYCGRTGAC